MNDFIVARIFLFVMVILLGISLLINDASPKDDA